MRNDIWLSKIYQQIRNQYFPEIVPSANILIKFGRRAKTRLGSIRKNPKNSQVIIIINGLLKERDIPDNIIKATLAHELSHYIHGFHSHLKQRYDYPHAGGVIRIEFKKRGIEKLYIDQKKWLKKNWPTIINKYFTSKSVKVKRSSRKIIIPFWYRW